MSYCLPQQLFWEFIQFKLKRFEHLSYLCQVLDLFLSASILFAKIRWKSGYNIEHLLWVFTLKIIRYFAY
jgi:hypothetical protein